MYTKQSTNITFKIHNPPPSSIECVHVARSIWLDLRCEQICGWKKCLLFIWTSHMIASNSFIDFTLQPGGFLLNNDNYKQNLTIWLPHWTLAFLQHLCFQATVWEREKDKEKFRCLESYINRSTVVFPFSSRFSV